MNDNEFNNIDNSISVDANNKQPDEYFQSAEFRTTDHNNNPKKKKKVKNTAASFLFLVVGASVTVVGLGGIIIVNNEQTEITIQKIEDKNISFTYLSDFEDLSGRVYNDFEEIPCTLENVEKTENGKFFGYGFCNSLRANTKYTLSLDGKTVFGNASRGKQTFTTAKEAPAPSPKSLTKIEVQGFLETRIFHEGDIFNPKGLSVIASFDNSETEDVTEIAKWSSEPLTVNTTSVSVSYTYNSDTLSASYSDFEVLPNVINVSGVEVNNETLQIENKSIVYLEYKVFPENATDKTVTFLSSNEEIATINADGLITAIEPGETTITVKTNDGNFESSTLLTVTQSHTWQEDVVVSTSFENLNNDVIQYSIDLKDEINNISKFIFRYYTLDSEIITEVEKDAYLPRVGTTQQFSVDIKEINHDEFMVVMFVIRNGQEEALSYSESYNMKEIYTHVEDITVDVDNSFIKTNNILYFKVNVDDPYNFYSNLRATLTVQQGIEINGIVDVGNITTGYFRFSDYPNIGQPEKGLLNIYITYNNVEYTIYNGEINLYLEI